MRTLAAIILFSFKFSFAQTSLTRFVNPFVGTGGHGHTFPGASMPFGMVQLSPDTRIDGSWDGCGGYHYSDSVIYGFSHTHLSGTGISDYGDILLMPTAGNPVLKPFKDGSYKNGYASHFSHSKEKASPGYYAVHLDDDDIDVELTVTQRVGFHKYVFQQSGESNIILDLTHRDKVIESSMRVVDSRHVEGMRRSKAWADNQVIYFALEFSKQFTDFGMAINDSLKSAITDARDTDIKSFFSFNTTKGEAIYVKVGISGVSAAGARNNLEGELPDWDFEEVRTNADATWNYWLSRIEVSGGTEDQKRIFYTAMYHCLLAPNTYSDADGNYLGRDFKVHQARYFTYYTVFSLWDTFRALHPLFTIIAQRQETDFIKTFLLQYEQGGRLPVWELSSNETDCMIGYHSVSVIADAAVKGIKDIDYSKALLAMKHSADRNVLGLNFYKENGYISTEDEGESVSKTLEYAYDDWCIAQMARMNNDHATYQQFMVRSQSWKNIFDPSTGFMRPRKNGNFVSPFDPYQVNFNYTEANAWQYAFTAVHDLDGLISRMGGKEKFEAKLDTLFSTTSKTTGREQADITGMIGQYAQGNEPSHHMAYLYNYAGKSSKTQRMVRYIMDEMYHDAPDGLSGNEDCGQMSAWYVLSAMGFYPVTPGLPSYDIGSPLFDTVKIHLENQKKFTLIAKNNSKDHPYIQSIKINGHPSDSITLLHSTIMSGATVEFEMTSQPAHTLTAARPAAATIEPIVTVPVIKASNNAFTDTLNISLVATDPDARIYYTLNGDQPTTRSIKYTKSLTLNKSSTVKAIAVGNTNGESKVATGKFTKTEKNWKISYLTPYNSQYTGGSNMALMDLQSGTNDFRSGTWQGWWGDDMEIVIDLKVEKNVSKVGAEFLQDQRSWIMMPSRVEFEISSDGKNFTSVALVNNTISDKETNTIVSTFSDNIPKQQARYIKIKAFNYGTLPDWHVGAGGKAWIFCDEVVIE